MVITPHLTAKFRSTSASTTATNVPTSSGAPITSITLYGVNVINGDTGAIYVKFYNKADATSADTPQFTLSVAAGVGSETLLRGADIAPYFDTACSFRVCTGFADSDNTAAGTAPIVELLYAPT